MPKQVPYTFLTEWHLQAPLPAAWDMISQPLHWPEWWKGVEQVTELVEGDHDGIGSVMSYTWKSRLPYRLTFKLQLVEREEYRLLRGIASGDLEGVGTTIFQSTKEGTLIRFIWEVATSKPWMNTLSFSLKPLFSYNHRLVMRQGAKCLAAKLSCRLL